MFMKVLIESDNVILVSNIVGFLTNLICAHTSPIKKKYMKRELIELEIYDLFEIIQLRLVT